MLVVSSPLDPSAWPKWTSFVMVCTPSSKPREKSAEMTEKPVATGVVLTDPLELLLSFQNGCSMNFYELL